jgi:hypothetical protein
MFKARKPFVRVGGHVCWVVMASRGATRLTGCVEWECKYYLPTHCSRHLLTSLEFPGLGKGIKKMDWDVLCWTAVQWNGSGRVGMQPSTTLLLCLITDSSHKGCLTR